MGMCSDGYSSTKKSMCSMEMTVLKEIRVVHSCQEFQDPLLKLQLVWCMFSAARPSWKMERVPIITLKKSSSNVSPNTIMSQVLVRLVSGESLREVLKQGNW